MLMRRLRGVLMSMLFWAIPWAVFGVGVGFAFQFGLIPVDLITPRVPGGLPTLFGLSGAILGAVNGLSFALLLLLAERNRGLESLRAWRVGAWGAIATSATIWLALREPLVAMGFAVPGFLVGASALWLARHGRSSEVLMGQS